MLPKVEEIFVVPAGLESLGLDACPHGFVLLEHIERQVPGNGQVLSGVIPSECGSRPHGKPQ
jgi:hypothetical protein